MDQRGGHAVDVDAVDGAVVSQWAIDRREQTRIGAIADDIAGSIGGTDDFGIEARQIIRTFDGALMVGSQTENVLFSAVIAQTFDELASSQEQIRCVYMTMTNNHNKKGIIDP